VDYTYENYEKEHDESVHKEYNKINPNDIYEASPKKIARKINIILIQLTKMKSYPIQQSQQNQKNPNQNQNHKCKNYLKKQHPNQRRNKKI
jgi:hypothetical protein